MKIDTDLRSAIRSAEKAQPQFDWREMDVARAGAIADLFKRKPSVARAAKKLAAAALKAEAAENAAREALCKKFGLRTAGDKFEFASCDNDNAAFKKVGGKVPTKGTRWKFDDVMRELAAATPQEGAKIIKRLGINWE